MNIKDDEVKLPPSDNLGIMKVNIDIEDMASGNIDYKFTEIFDLFDIQEIQDAFSSAVGVASIITEVDGTIITNPSNFCCF